MSFELIAAEEAQQLDLLVAAIFSELRTGLALEPPFGRRDLLKRGQGWSAAMSLAAAAAAIKVNRRW